MGLAIDEIQNQCPLGILHYVSGHSYSVPVCVRTAAGREIGKVTTGNYVEFLSRPDLKSPCIRWTEPGEGDITSIGVISPNTDE